MRDWAIRVEDSAVVVASGERIRADYIVLATGSRYPFPAKIDSFDTHDALVRYRAAHDALAQAGRVLLLGAGPVGIELASEITSAWPDKSLVLVNSAPHPPCPVRSQPRSAPNCAASWPNVASSWRSAAPYATSRRDTARGPRARSP